MVGVFGLAGLGVLLGDGSSAQDVALQVGVCIDGLTFSDDEGTFSVGSLQERSCGRPHDAEVYYVFTDTQARRANASEDAFNAVGLDVCVAEYAPYAGASLAHSGLAATAYGSPVLGPSSADEDIACVVTDPNGPMTGTARGSREPGEAPPVEKPMDDLAEGDCIDGLSAQSSVTFSLEVLDCSEPHAGEVFGAFEMTGDEYPDDFDLVAGERCVDLFDAYVGKSFEESTLDIAPLTPTAPSWEAGDRGVLCILVAYYEGEQLTASMKDAGV